MQNKQNREHIDAGSPYRTSSVEYSLLMHPLRYMAIWNPSKPPRHSRLEACFLLHIFLLSFASHKKNHAIYNLPINYLLVNEKWNFNIWNKKIILILILPNYNVIFPNPHCNIIISFLWFKFFLAVKNYKRKILVISIN
jgi:hypothetical protein